MEEDESVSRAGLRTSFPFRKPSATVTGFTKTAINLLSTPAVALTTTFASLISIAAGALSAMETTNHFVGMDNFVQRYPQNQSSFDDYDDSTMFDDQSTATDKYTNASSVAVLTQSLDNLTSDVIDAITIRITSAATIDAAGFFDGDNYTNATTIEPAAGPVDQDNYWALFALVLVVGTAAGNILVCLAIAWERRLQNVTNYFLMSLAITDLMVAILVMPLGILTLVKGE